MLTLYPTKQQLSQESYIRKLYQVKNIFFFSHLLLLVKHHHSLSPSPPLNCQERVNFFETAVAVYLGIEKLFLTKKTGWGVGGGGKLVFCGDLAYVKKVDYFWGGYRNGKLLCTYGALHLNKRKNNLNSSF